MPEKLRYGFVSRLKEALGIITFFKFFEIFSFALEGSSIIKVCYHRLLRAHGGVESGHWALLCS